MSRRPIHAALAAGAATLALVLPAAPASAQLIVFDPSNFAQNVLTAARALQQINNQIQQLQNQAQSLMNQARNLANLPLSTLTQLQGDVSRTQALLSQAQNITYNVGQIDQAFQTQYGSTSLTTSDQQLVLRALARWQTTIASLQDSLEVQAGVVANLDSTRTEMNALVSSSQGATGALQAAQAGNQLLAVQAKQLADLTALVAAQSRAQALGAADSASVHADAQAQFTQFTTTTAGYQPATVEMFH